jgi:hypothetical protein
MDGISGMKIYNVVRTSTRFLPKNYTDSLRFITTSVNHKLNNNDWETTIDTIVIPENYDKEGDKLILPYAERLEEVERILIEKCCIDLLTALSSEQITPTFEFQPSGYGEILNQCNPPFKPMLPTPNNTTDQTKAKKLISKIVEKATREDELGDIPDEWKDNVGLGRCAVGVKNIAQEYWKYFSDQNKSITEIQPWQFKSGLYPGNAKDKTTHDTLVSKFTYIPFVMGQYISKQEAIKLTQDIQSQASVGDIVAYYANQGEFGNPIRFGHIQMYMGDNKWVSDYKHDSFVYKNKNNECWTVIYLYAPPITIQIKD